MKPADLVFLYAYNDWANQRILTTTRSAGTIRCPDVTRWGSVRDVLVHMLSAEWIWRLRCAEDQAPTSLLCTRGFPNLGCVVARQLKQCALVAGRRPTAYT